MLELLIRPVERKEDIVLQHINVPRQHRLGIVVFDDQLEHLPRLEINRLVQPMVLMDVRCAGAFLDGFRLVQMLGYETTLVNQSLEANMGFHQNYGVPKMFQPMLVFKNRNRLYFRKSIKHRFCKF